MGANGDAGEQLLAVEVDHAPGTARAVVRVAGEVDTATAGELSAALEKVVADGATDLRLELGAVPFMDSTGLTALIAARTMLDGRGEVVVERASSTVRRTFEVAGLDAFLAAP